MNLLMVTRWSCQDRSTIQNDYLWECSSFEFKQMRSCHCDVRSII